MILWVVETLHAVADHGHFDLFDAVDEASKIYVKDKCCSMNTSDDDFIGECHGGCETRSPRIVEYRAERIEK